MDEWVHGQFACACCEPTAHTAVPLLQSWYACSVDGHCSLGLKIHVTCAA